MRRDKGLKRVRDLVKVNELRAMNGPFEGLKGVEVLIVCKLDRWQNQSRVVWQCNGYDVIAAHTQRGLRCDGMHMHLKPVTATEELHLGHAHNLAAGQRPLSQTNARRQVSA